MQPDVNLAPDETSSSQDDSSDTHIPQPDRPQEKPADQKKGISLALHLPLDTLNRTQPESVQSGGLSTRRLSARLSRYVAFFEQGAAQAGSQTSRVPAATERPRVNTVRDIIRRFDSPASGLISGVASAGGALGSALAASNLAAPNSTLSSSCSSIGPNYGSQNALFVSALKSCSESPLASARISTHVWTQVEKRVAGVLVGTTWKRVPKSQISATTMNAGSQTTRAIVTSPNYTMTPQPKKMPAWKARILASDGEDSEQAGDRTDDRTSLSDARYEEETRENEFANQGAKNESEGGREFAGEGADNEREEFEGDAKKLVDRSPADEQFRGEVKDADLCEAEDLRRVVSDEGVCNGPAAEDSGMLGTWENGFNEQGQENVQPSAIRLFEPIGEESDEDEDEEDQRLGSSFSEGHPGAAGPIRQPRLSGDGSDGNGNRRASHFVAIPINDAEVLSRVDYFQSALLSTAPFLEDFKANPNKLHLTLLVVSLAPHEIPRAEAAIRLGVQRFHQTRARQRAPIPNVPGHGQSGRWTEEPPSRPVARGMRGDPHRDKKIVAQQYDEVEQSGDGSLGLKLDFRVVGAFGTRVLFIAPPLVQRLMLRMFHVELARAFGEYGICIVGAGCGFTSAMQCRQQLMTGGQPKDDERPTPGGPQRQHSVRGGRSRPRTAQETPPSCLPQKKLRKSETEVCAPQAASRGNSRTPQRAHSIGSPSNELHTSSSCGAQSAWARVGNNECRTDSETFKPDGGVRGRNSIKAPPGRPGGQEPESALKESSGSLQEPEVGPRPKPKAITVLTGTTPLDRGLLRQYDLALARTSLYIPQVTLFKVSKTIKRSGSAKSSNSKIKLYPRLYHNLVQRVLKLGLPLPGKPDPRNSETKPPPAPQCNPQPPYFEQAPSPTIMQPPWAPPAQWPDPMVAMAMMCQNHVYDSSGAPLGGRFSHPMPMPQGPFYPQHPPYGFFPQERPPGGFPHGPPFFTGGVYGQPPEAKAQDARGLGPDYMMGFAESQQLFRGDYYGPQYPGERPQTAHPANYGSPGPGSNHHRNKPPFQYGRGSSMAREEFGGRFDLPPEGVRRRGSRSRGNFQYDRVVTTSWLPTPPFGSLTCSYIELLEMSQADSDGYYKRLCRIGLDQEATSLPLPT